MGRYSPTRWQAIRDGYRTSQELQFFLDGQELWDLRLGRESWSPKRLPMKLPQGRHVMLVRAQDKNALPEVHLRIRELELPSDGHFHIISNEKREEGNASRKLALNQ
jgi:hypothetical protein